MFFLASVAKKKLRTKKLGSSDPENFSQLSPAQTPLVSGDHATEHRSVGVAVIVKKNANECQQLMIVDVSEPPKP